MAAKKHLDVIMPGYTHLQRAQPVLLSHHLLAYYDMFERDRERFADCSGADQRAAAGLRAPWRERRFPIDRAYVAKLLGFSARFEE